ncbi:MAG: FAD-dependent oxidoreductase [Planctomycetota bacterium]
MGTKREYDVCVAGGGVAGVAAALEAARQGARTALVEKTLLWGGLATAGIVNIYLPLCDGRGRQAIFGLGEDLLHASKRYGPGRVREDWADPETPSRYVVVFSPAAFVLAMDELLEAAGVELLLDTMVVDVLRDGPRVTGLRIANKDGLSDLHAACTVDATGDADVAVRAGAACVAGTNHLSIWSVEASMEAARDALDRNAPEALLAVCRLGGDDAGRGAPPGGKTYTGIDADAVTEFTLATRRMLREHYAALPRDEPGRCPDAYPVTLPTVPPYRMTRRIEGVTTVGGEDAGRRFADAVGVFGDWRKPGVVWEVPYGCLVPRETDGLLAAGRCVASADDAWQAFRVIPAAALTGQVAGLAAATSAAGKTTPRALDTEALRQDLAGRGWPLHADELGKQREDPS